MKAYYNEIDPCAAQWLRNLIEAGHIAPGIVDERSIEDVLPGELVGFTQCHFFAGIGVWSYALRQAGWPDDRPVWTGSCPCQPFSSAGKGAGFDDERHLWPAFQHLISQCKPAIVLGEQVASKDADPWIDLVHTDMEALGYAFGAIPFPSAGIGAPHIRDRLYWVADAIVTRLEGHGRNVRDGIEPGRVREIKAGSVTQASAVSELADTQQHHRGSQATTTNHGKQEADRPTNRTGGCGVLSGGVANTERKQCQDRLSRPGQSDCTQGGWSAVESSGLCSDGNWPGPINGFWRDADWLFCRDGKWRPVEPGTFPLAHGAAARVGRLRAYGNAINAQAAQVFIECVMESV